MKGKIKAKSLTGIIFVINFLSFIKNSFSLFSGVWDFFKKRLPLRRDYNNAEKNVKRGDLDKINDTFRK